MHDCLDCLTIFIASEHEAETKDEQLVRFGGSRTYCIIDEQGKRLGG